MKKKITLRIPTAVYKALKKISNDTGIPIHSLILFALCHYIDVFVDNSQ